MNFRGFLFAGLVLALTAGALIWRLADHDLTHRVSEPLEVTVAGIEISGTIWLPDEPVIAAVALVHGDGAQDRTMSGGYAPMINALLDQGVAVASWDKPGVGQSQGNWLLQSMRDRTTETRQVLQFLDERFAGKAIGALGFSQAGWVLPSLTHADADFLILIGAAVSWQDQGDYFTRVRLRRAGSTDQEIERVLAKQAKEDDRIFGQDATVANAPAGMSPDRWRFIHQNRHANSRQALTELDLPLLALWGAEDLNVDPNRNAKVFQDILGARDTPTRIRIVPAATHGLLKAPDYNWQLSEDWSFFAVGRFLIEGRFAFAPGTLNEISEWTREIAEAQ